VAKYLFTALLSAGVCPLLALPLRRFALLVGAIDVPGQRSVHRAPTPRLGGVAILLACATGLAMVCAFDRYALTALTSSSLWTAAAAVALVGMAGIGDDIFSLSALTKLLVEIAASVLAFVGGYGINTFLKLPLGWLSFPATMMWILVVTNAFNLVDGLDGLAAGIAAIISAAMFMLSLLLNSVQGALVLAALTGALVGFLPFNFPPARLFLGDSGSLSIGIILALMSIETSNKLAAGLTILVPTLAMGLPLVEITTTVLRRILRAVHVVRREEGKEHYKFLFAGNAALFTADRDHIHHRLLSLGLNRRTAVLILYAVTVLLCTAGFALAFSRGVNQALLLATCGIAAVAAVRHLRYEELQPLNRGILMPILEMRGLNQRSMHAFVDLVCITVSYLAALIMTVQASGPTLRAELFQSLPLLCFAQLSALVVSGLYRRSFRYAGIADVGPLGKSVGLAGLVGLVAEWVIKGTPAFTVSILDTYFLGTLIFGSRVSFRLLDYVRAASLRNGRPVLIYGAGRAGLLALTELRSNPGIGRFAIGFLDDDQSKQGSRVSGLPVYGASGLSKLIERGQFAELLITSAKIPTERLRDITFRCTSAGIVVRRLVIEWLAVAMNTSATPPGSSPAHILTPAVADSPE
jgi:UDP-GlcNAc:undecaprenyl-phosphate/decaprenyl-phosphate GlcNAc-1-phosphate transferase